MRKLTSTTARVELDFHDLANNLTEAQAHSLITVIDLAQQSVEFTEDVIKALVISLKKEYIDLKTGEIDPEYKNFIKTLKKV